MSFNYKYFFFAPIAFILLFSAIVLTKNITSNTKDPEVTINNKTYSIEVAESTDDQQIGLSKYSSIEETQGMWFPVNHMNQPSVWMKNMQFPIDIVWVNDNTVVGTEQHVSHENQEQIYSPNQPITAILELNAGEVEKVGIKVGQKIDTVNIP